MNKIESYFRIILCTSFHFASIHEVDSFLTTLNSHIQRISIIRQRKDKRIICIKIHCTDNGEIDNIRIIPFRLCSIGFKIAISSRSHITFIIRSTTNILLRQPRTVTGIQHKNADFIIISLVRIYGTTFGSTLYSYFPLYSQCRASSGTGEDSDSLSFHGLLVTHS